jgi:uncharacterized protein YceK
MAVRAIAFGVLLSSVAATGCGTVTNLVGCRPEVESKTPFGGVHQDVYCLKAAADGQYGKADQKPPADPRPQLGLVLLFAADLPLSAVADLLMWPYTCSYTLINEPVPTPPMILATTESPRQPFTPNDGPPQRLP